MGGDLGLANTYRSNDGFYINWVHISSDKISFYKEYNVGGMVSEAEYKIPKYVKNSIDSFRGFINNIFDKWEFN
ncbi:MAG: hypothetical protein ACOC22_02890 [bacterium]